MSPQAITNAASNGDLIADAPIVLTSVIPVAGSLAALKHCATCACNRNRSQKGNSPVMHAVARTVNPHSASTSITSQHRHVCENTVAAGPASTTGAEAAQQQNTAVRHSHQCSVCQERFTRRSTLRRHQRDQHEPRSRIPCPHTTCAYHIEGFARQDTLARHLKRKH